MPSSSYYLGINFPDVLKAILNFVSASVEEVPIAACLPLDESSVPASEVGEIPNMLLQSTTLSDYDLVKAQRADSYISKVLTLVRSGQRPKPQLVESDHSERKCVRYWEKLVIEDGILLCHASVDGKAWKQLCLPKEFRDIVYWFYHDDLG